MEEEVEREAGWERLILNKRNGEGREEKKVGTSVDFIFVFFDLVIRSIGYIQSESNTES